MSKLNEFEKAVKIRAKRLLRKRSFREETWKEMEGKNKKDYIDEVPYQEITKKFHDKTKRA